MPDNLRRERRFNDEEVALIIKRAAELQQTERVEPSTALTLSDVEQIAREAGIDPELIRRAALGLDRPAPEARPSVWFGSPTHLVFERVVEGEIPTDEFEPMVAEIRRSVGDNGIPSVLGRTLSWTSSPAGRRSPSTRKVDVSVVSRDGLTTIRVEEQLQALAGGLFGGLVGGGGGGTTGATIAIGMGIFHSAPLTGLLWIAVAGGFYTLARTIFGRMVSKRESQLKELTNRLEVRATSVAAVPLEKLSAGGNTPR